MATVSIAITPVNTAPTIAEISDQVTVEDTQLQISVEVTDGEDDLVVIDIAGGPLHGVVDSTTTVDGFNFTVFYTPEFGYNGLDNVVLQATEVESGLSSDQVDISITITFINDIPVAQSFELDMVEDDTVSITLVGYDEETSDSLLTFEIVDNVSNGTLTSNRALAEYTYMPDPESSGSDSFTYRVYDGFRFSRTGASFTGTMVIDTKAGSE
jgi:hypothetical protein